MTKSTEQLLNIDRNSVFHSSTHLKQYAAGELPGRIITGKAKVFALPIPKGLS